MGEHDLVAEVEAAGYRCWPARELHMYDGWELRYADGFSGRANSVLPVGESTLALDTKLGFCGDWFGRRGVSLELRCTPLCEPGIDDELATRGYTVDRPTRVMVADLDGRSATGPVPEEHPSDRWWRAMAGLWGIGEERQPAWRGIIDRIETPAAYGLMADGGHDIAAGLAVADGSWLGLFEVIVAPDRRRRGHGSELVRSLLAWGRSKDAERAFLQVVAVNRSALALYGTLGFRHAYDYWYRRAPQDTPANNPA